MTPPGADAAATDFAFLTELLGSQELWIERAAEGEALARSIAESPSPIVVLLGPPRAGKTELLRRWVVPMLSRTFTVSYRESCTSPEGSDDDRRADIAIWDSFEDCLTDERIADGSPGGVVAELARLVAERRKVVLCANDGCLSRLFELSGAVPQLRGEVLQIPPLACDRVVQTLHRLSGRHGIGMGESFRRALSADLKALLATNSIGVELIAIVVFELRRTIAPNRELDEEDYAAAGGLNGILEAHLDFMFERLPDGIDAQIGWAVVQEIVTTAWGTAVDLDNVARRLGVAKDAPWRVVRWLEEERRALRPRRPAGGYDLMPPQLVTAVAARIRREAAASEHIHGALQQGVRTFVASEALLSLQGFKRIHGQRSAIKVNDEQAMLMLRCALAYEDAQLPGAIDYWLQRVAHEPARVEVLFDALFDADANIRHRAVKRLVGVNQPEIRNQLDLLALRDPTQVVRADAVAALDAIKDQNLRRSLLQEIDEPNSPYRLQAIEALRMFTDADATSALVKIVHRNAPGQDADARLKAIEVLGTQNTAPAADALLDIALADQDADDRACASSALGSITDEALLARVLEKLRRMRSRAAGLRPSFSTRSAARTGALAIGAAVAVVVNVFVHGLLLGAIGRRRLAVAVFALEATGVGLLLAAPAAGLVVWLTSLAIGTLLAMRILLHERLDFKPQSPFARCLSAVLFAFCSVTFFLYLHGLPPMLARRMRRGLVLLGFEILGVIFVMSALYFEDEFAAIMIGTAPRLLFGSFAFIGPLVMGVTYVMGVGGVLLEAFVLRDRRAALQRIDDVCSHLLQSAAVLSMVFRSLAAQSRDEARWGGELANRFGEWLQEPLRQHWPKADLATKRRIFAFLAGRRDAAAVQFLRAVAPSVGWGARVRAFWASLAFRFSMFPRPLLVAIALVLYAQIAISAGLFAMFMSQPDRLLAVVEDPAEPVERRREAVSRLRLIAQQQQDRQLAMTAATGLGGALASNSLPGPLASDILEAIVEVAPAAENQRELVDSVVRLLGQSGTQTQAIDAVARIGSPYAALKLAEFARDRIEFVLGASVAGAPGEEAIAAARGALKALTSIQECGEETVRLLTALGARRPASQSGPDSPVASAVLSEVRDITGQLDPLSRAEYFLIEQNYTAAIAAGNRVMEQVPIDASRRERARTLVGRAYASRGALAVATDDETARDDLFAALDAGLAYTAPGEVLGLGLQVAYQFHEFHADGYNIVNDVLSRIEPLAMTQEQALRESVRANLAESNLTVGRYDDAIAIAEDLVAQPSADRSTVLNMKYMLFAALTLKGDRPRADQALADLNSYLGTIPEDFSNTWSYMGTARYINRVAPEPAKQVLLETITRISRGG